MIERSKEYSLIGRRLIRTEYKELKEAGARVAFLKSDKEKRQNHKIVYADTKPVTEQYKWCCHYDFMITVYEPNICGFNDEQVEILLRHELLHCGIDNDGDEPKFYVAPHDFEEFYSIMDRYGLDWDKER